jgi:hypothetical protein
MSQPWVYGGCCSRVSETSDDDDDFPTNINWKEKGAVNDVMDQLNCATPFLKILINKLK